MKVLAIDTTTPAGSLALVEGGRVVAGLGRARRLDHSERVLDSIDYLFSSLRFQRSDLAAVAVTRGPGSFTGVRVGLASAGGLARGLGIPALGLSSLEALALSAPPGPPGRWIATWVSAGRGEVYAAAYQRGGPAGFLRECLPPSLVAPERWLAALPACPVGFVGDGAVLHADLLGDRRGPDCLLGGAPWFLAPSLGLWAQGELAAGSRTAPGALEPLYLRPSDAETGRGKAG
jgi:tRNA threonylcarbamoyladenosine biosynthesis protein TsaB